MDELILASGDSGIFKLHPVERAAVGEQGVLILELRFHAGIGVFDLGRARRLAGHVPVAPVHRQALIGIIARAHHTDLLAVVGECRAAHHVQNAFGKLGLLRIGSRLNGHHRAARVMVAKERSQQPIRDSGKHVLHVRHVALRRLAAGAQHPGEIPLRL